nr:MAG TPA: hypothetical protein [Caudoviricetes sp.]
MNSQSFYLKRNYRVPELMMVNIITSFLRKET